MILLIDNYDSFTFNLAQYLGELGAPPLVRRNDEIGVDEIACLIDFLDDERAILESLEYVNQVRESFSPEALNQYALETVGAFMDSLDD